MSQAASVYAYQTLFLKPTAFNVSTLLQTIAIASYLAQRTQGGLISFFFPREAEQQRFLNYGSVQTATRGQASALLSGTVPGSHFGDGSHAVHKVHISQRGSLDQAALLLEPITAKRAVGLRELAPLIGLHLGKGWEHTETREARRHRGEEAKAYDAKGTATIEVKLGRSAWSATRDRKSRSLDSKQGDGVHRALLRFRGFGGQISM